MNAASYRYRRFVLPSGRLTEVRRVTEEEGQPEVTLRYVNDNDELSPNEFHMSLHFLLTRAQEVRRA